MDEDLSGTFNGLDHHRSSVGAKVNIGSAHTLGRLGRRNEHGLLLLDGNRRASERATMGLGKHTANIRLYDPLKRR